MIHARDVCFDFDDVPVRIPGEGFDTPVIDVMDLVLPEGDSDLYHALAESPSCGDDDQRLREALQGLGREKAIHAGARGAPDSAGFVAHPAIRASTRFVVRILDYRGCDRRMTAGHRQLEDQRMDPTMLGLMCRRGGKGVEYRSAVSDACAYRDGAGSHARWARTAVVGLATLLAALVFASAYMFRKALHRGRGLRHG